MKKIRIGLITALVIVQILFFFIMRQVTNIDSMIVFFDMNLFVDFTTTKYIINIIAQSPDAFLWINRFYILDTIFPILYGVLVATFLSQYISRKSVFIILVGVLLDYFENIMILTSISNNEMTKFGFNLLKVVSPLKFMMLGIAIILVLIQVGKEHTHENNTTSN